jgi:hypothetical protein
MSEDYEVGITTYIDDKGKARWRVTIEVRNPGVYYVQPFVEQTGYDLVTVTNAAAREFERRMKQ